MRKFYVAEMTTQNDPPSWRFIYSMLVSNSIWDQGIFWNSPMARAWILGSSPAMPNSTVNEFHILPSFYWFGQNLN